MTNKDFSIIADASVVMAIGSDLRYRKARFIEAVSMEYLPGDIQPMPYAEMREACAAGIQNCHKCPDLTCCDNQWLKELVRMLRKGLIADQKVAGAIVALATEALDELIPFRDINFIETVSTNEVN